MKIYPSTNDPDDYGADGLTWQNYGWNKDIGDCILMKDRDEQNQTCEDCIRSIKYAIQRTKRH